MDNRTTCPPILFCSLVLSLPFLAHAEPGVPAANVVSTNTPPLTASPSAAVTPMPTMVSPDETTPEERPSTYTVVSGDSLWLIAHKFGCSVKALMKANNLTKKNLKPGQVLRIPSPTSPSSMKTEKTAPPTPTPAPTVRPNASTHSKPSHHKSYAQAQPVQDFDIPASTFASCPVPVPTSDPDADVPQSDSGNADAHAMRAELVSPSEFNPPPAPAPKPVAKPTPEIAATVAPEPVRKSIPISTFSARQTNPTATFAVSPSKPANQWFNPFYAPPAEDWGSRFLQQARALADRDIDYDEEWRPPGEAHAWAMDCSNTARYLYKVTAGIQLPRTASDQYYYLHLQDKAWDVPETDNGYADCNYLREHLKPGDLLFWKNTYRPERQPPITHVMIFLGTNARDQWIMAGSQTSRGGEHNRADGGPDIYIFDPTKPCGGYTTWLGLVHHRGSFCAYGRPLEADPAKLAVASN
ncbi:MAG: LysM peptidoglycan-binding domain-containing protein [Methylacidiphilales bacterium]|nr:LysM peptidoglycan-binding domain-containing protein [Candidatus Methylacidiphilales bacterium]